MGTFSTGGVTTKGKLGQETFADRTVVSVKAKDGSAKIHLIYIMPESGEEVVYKVLHRPQDIIGAFEVPAGTYDVDVVEIGPNTRVFAEFE